MAATRLASVSSHDEQVDQLRYDAPREELAPYVPTGVRRVLDVGCGVGGFGRTVRGLVPGVELWGVEPVAAAADAARNVYDRVVTGFFPQNTPDLPVSSFDAVFMLDVLEHMPDPEPALRAARSLLSQTGVLVASIPNVRHFDVWWPLVRHGTWTYTDMGLMDRTHLRWFTRSSIEDLFAAAGWDIVTLDGINRTDPVGWKARSIARLGRRTEDMFFVQYVVVARPRSEQ
jgi:SAM-dependent methyltransferase